MTARKFVPRPDQVKVGNHTYSIVWVDHTEMSQQTDRQDVDGATFDTRQTIYVKLYDDDTDESHYQEVLMHELTHAVWGSAKLTHMASDLSKMPDLEETTILLQSPGMLALLRDNPHVVQYLTSTR